MVFSPDIIKTVIDEGDGLAKGSHYIALIEPPPAMLGLSSILTGLNSVLSVKNSLFLAAKTQSTSIPGKKLATTPFQMYGTVQEMPYGINYATWSATFMCTNSMQERNFFDSWFRSITDPFSNNFKYYDEWVSNVNIIKVPPGAADLGTEDLVQAALSFAGGIGNGINGVAEQSGIYYCRLEEAYPVEISTQEMSFDSDTYLTLNVDFQYRRYKTNAEALNNSLLF